MADIAHHLSVAFQILESAKVRETCAVAVKPSSVAAAVRGMASAHNLAPEEDAVILAIIENGALSIEGALRPYNPLEAGKLRNLSVAASFARMGRLDDDMAAADDLAFQQSLAAARGQIS